MELQHLPGRRSPPTWSVLVWLSCPSTPSPSSCYPSDLAHLPRWAPPHQGLPMREAGFCSSIAMASNTATCARDQTQRELLPQGVHRLWHHQARSPGWKWRWWICHSRPPLRPIQGAWWWHTPWWWHGGNSGSRNWPRGNHIDLRQCVFPWLINNNRRDQMVLGDFNAHHPSWFSRTGETGQQQEGRPSMGRSTVRNLLLRTKISLLSSLPWVSPPLQMSLLWASISSLMRRGPPLCSTTFL